MKLQVTFPELLQSYFIERLIGQRNASPNTVASHRDTFRLLLGFANRCLHKVPTELVLDDLDPAFIVRFLDHLEKERNNCSRSRNVRLAAIHSFFAYVAFQEPSLCASAQRVLAIPGKRFKSKPIDFLTRSEIEALLEAPDQTTWAGRRDRTLLLVAVQTGLRVSELVSLCCKDVALETGAHVRCTGKGAKERCTPLRKEAISALRKWLPERQGKPEDALFPNAHGQSLSRDGVEYLLAKHVRTAHARCPSLKSKRVSPHVLRHSLAMDMLQHGVDRSVIALWLGHESMNTTQVYLHANMELKEQALAKTKPLNTKYGRYRATDALLTFLQGL